MVLQHGEVCCNRKAWWAGKTVLQDTQGVLQDSECSGFKTVLQYSLVDSRCIAIHKIVLQAGRSCTAKKKKGSLYCNTKYCIMARDRAACVARQAAVSRHSAGA